MLRCLVSGVVVFFIAASEILLARPVTREDLGLELNFLHLDVKVKADGSSITTTKRKATILRDDARRQNGIFVYNPMNQKFRVVEAYSVSPEGEKKPVRKRDIEDKPLASSDTIFDTLHQVLFVYPDVQVGTQVYYEVVMEQTIASIPDHFSAFYSLAGQIVNEFSLTLASEVPIYYRAFDPIDRIEIRTESKKKGMLLKASLKEPTLFGYIEERSFFDDESTLLGLVVSTTDRWENYALKLLPEYEKRLLDPLPKAYEDLKNSVAQIKDPHRQLDELLSKFSDLIRYQGDFRTVRGGFIPRPLSEIASTRYGDCKDMSLSIARILRALGYEAHLAWVYRDEDATFDILEPVLTQFNHAIVRASKDGKVYWLDPTNPIVTSRYAFPDIQDRIAFVLDLKNPRLEKTPKQLPQDHVIVVREEVNLSHLSETKTKGRFSFQNLAARRWAGLELFQSPENIRKSFLEYLIGSRPVSSWKISNPPLRDRIVEDLEFGYEFSSAFSASRTNAGYSYRLPGPPALSSFNEDFANRMSGYIFDFPRSYESTLKLTGMRPMGNVNLNCKIESPWVEAERNVTYQSQSVTVKDRFKMKETVVKPKVLKSPDFQKVQQDLLECFDGNQIIYQPLSKRAL